MKLAKVKLIVKESNTIILDAILISESEVLMYDEKKIPYSAYGFYMGHINDYGYVDFNQEEINEHTIMGHYSENKIYNYYVDMDFKFFDPSFIFIINQIKEILRNNRLSNILPDETC